MMKKRHCTQTCQGIIKDIRHRGIDSADLLIIEYEVNGMTYEIKENLIMKPDEKIKLGFLPIGYRTKSLIEIRTGKEIQIGQFVKVMYNPDDPAKAFLPDNDAKINWI